MERAIFLQRGLWKQQSYFFFKVNEFIGVKVVIMLNLRDEKVIFIAFYVNDLNKTVP